MGETMLCGVHSRPLALRKLPSLKLASCRSARVFTSQQDQAQCVASSKRRRHRRTFTSDFVGVHRESSGGRLRASITIQNKVIQLGNFATEVEAALAYDEVARPLGRRTNFTDSGSRIHVQKTNSSMFHGVSWNTEKMRWKSGITVRGEKIFLGYFEDEESA